MNILSECGKCKNCGGKIEFSLSDKIASCPYCDSVFLVSSLTKSIGSSTDNPNQAAEKSNSFILCKVSLNGMNENARNTLLLTGKLLAQKTPLSAYMKNILAKSAAYTDVAYPGKNDELFKKMLGKIPYPQGEKESYYIYQSTGLLSKDKKGYILSSSCIYFIDKSKVYRLYYSQITKMRCCFQVNSWDFNDNHDYCVDFPASMKSEDAALFLGFICEMVRKSHDEGFQMVVDRIYR